MTVKNFETYVSFSTNQKPEADKDCVEAVPTESRQYLNIRVCESIAKPLEELEKYNAIYPNLYEIAQVYLGILAISVKKPI